MFTSPLNMYLKDRDRPKGAMKPLPDLMETELESFGASVMRILHGSNCSIPTLAMCGRCTSVCPAHRQENL